MLAQLGERHEVRCLDWRSGPSPGWARAAGIGDVAGEGRQCGGGGPIHE
ncbi:hypothetical protein ACGFWD_26660 [Streptomyces sp. NPDC048448]